MDGFGAALAAGFLLIVTAIVGVLLESLLATRGRWSDGIRARRVRAMRLAVGIAALGLFAVPIVLGVSQPW
jgi:hypothetical protein